MRGNSGDDMDIGNHNIMMNVPPCSLMFEFLII